MPKIQRFAERPAGRRTGIKWGRIHNPLYISQAVIEALVAPPEQAHVSQAVIEVLIQPPDGFAHVSQAALEALIEV